MKDTDKLYAVVLAHAGTPFRGYPTKLSPRIRVDDDRYMFG